MLLAVVACSSSNDKPSDKTTNQTSTAANEAPMVGKYKEAPKLAQLVKAGTLAAVEQRLPEEPAVIEAKDVGKYGGVFKGAAFGPKSGQLDTEGFRLSALLTVESDLKTFKPNILKDYSVSDDFTTYTFNLRKGMKWSNGDPLTADDFMF